MRSGQLPRVKSGAARGSPSGTPQADWPVTAGQQQRMDTQNEEEKAQERRLDAIHKPTLELVYVYPPNTPITN